MKNGHAPVIRGRPREGSHILASSFSPHRAVDTVTSRLDSKALRVLSSLTSETIDDLTSSASSPQEVTNILLYSLTHQVSAIQKSVVEVRQSQECFRSALAASELESRARHEQLLSYTKLPPVQPMPMTEVQVAPTGIDKSLVEDLQKSLVGYDEELKNVAQEFKAVLAALGDQASKEPLVVLAASGDQASKEPLVAAANVDGNGVAVDPVADLYKSSNSPANLQSDDDLVQQRLEMLERQEAPKLWAHLQEEVEVNDKASVYELVLDKKTSELSFWHNVFDYLHVGWLLDRRMPDTWSARATHHWAFHSLSTVLILGNTGIMGYEADEMIKAALEDRSVPKWLDICSLVFNVIFAAELLFRMFALRTWFWVCPTEWGWNMFDVFLVASGLLSDVLNGVNLTFVRTLRILRAVRAARIIRVLRVFRQLRQMLLSILACLSSLAWTFVFLAMIMFMFSILFLNGASHFVTDMQDLPDSDAKDIMLDETTEWFGSLGSAMFSLLAAVTGGHDWIKIRQPLTYAGQMYSIGFVVYMLFVTVGVMNVLTGVFLSSADEFMDLDLIVQNEQMKVDTFCTQMMQIFREMDTGRTGLVDWPTFEKALRKNHVRHFLASVHLEPTHVGLIFDLLDQNRSGTVSIDEFVMGMVRLKGESKAIDSRIIQREIGLIPMLIQSMFNKRVLAAQTNI